MKVLFHYAPALTWRRGWRRAGSRYHICPVEDRALLARCLPETDVLWHALEPCTAEMIAAAPG